jgi:hypothetical protein
MFTSASSTPFVSTTPRKPCFQEERIRVQDRAMLYKFGKDNANLHTRFIVLLKSPLQ